MKFWRKPFDQEEKATRPSSIYIIRDTCKGCHYCVEFCPTGALAISDEVNAKGYVLPSALHESKCLGCGLCEAICPDFCITVIPEDKEE
ncbi:ferredoxin family protein [Chloroflexota bacterium]